MSASDKFWLRSLYEQIWAIPPAERNSYHWRINSQTWRILRNIKDLSGLPLYHPHVEPGSPTTLLGFPVQLDDTCVDAMFTPKWKTDRYCRVGCESCDSLAPCVHRRPAS